MRKMILAAAVVAFATTSLGANAQSVQPSTAPLSLVEPDGVSPTWNDVVDVKDIEILLNNGRANSAGEG